MAVESITVGDLVGDVHFILTNSATVDSDLGTQIKKWLNATMRDMIARSEFPAFKSEGTIQLSKDTQDYELADDFNRMIEPGVRHIRDGDEKITLRHIPQPTYDDVEGARWWTQTGIPTHYTFTGREQQTQGNFRMRVFPTPDEAYVLSYSYYSLPENIRAAADATEIDRRFPRDLAHVLVAGTCIYFDKYLTPQQVATYKEKYGEAILNLQRTARPLVGGHFQGDRFPAHIRHPLAGGAIIRGSIDPSNQDNWF